MFEEEKEIYEIKSEADLKAIDELEDVEIHIVGKVSISKKTTFVDCNILIDSDKNGQLEVIEKANLKFEECHILFSGVGDNPLIHGKNGDVFFEECDFEQCNKKAGSIPIFIVMDKPNQKIELLNCKMQDLSGMFLYSKDSSVYVENCTIKSLQGNLMCVEPSEGSKSEEWPSLQVIGCNFEDCQGFSSGAKLSSSNQKRLEMENRRYRWDACSTEGLVNASNLISGTVENCKFLNCSSYCLKARGYSSYHFKMENCEFENCHVFDERGEDKDQVEISIYNTEVANCNFINSQGMYIRTQFSKANIHDCVFEKCKKKGSLTGILTIFNEVDEQCIFVKNVEFASCAIESPYEYSDAKSGMIFICAGAPERNQAGTVVIEKCEYRNCKADKNIWGTEKQDGFFGKTIKFYIEK